MRRGVAGMLGIIASIGLLATPDSAAVMPPAPAADCRRGTGLRGAGPNTAGLNTAGLNTAAAARDRHEQSPPVNDLHGVVPAGNITIPVRFHVISSGRTGLLSEADVDRQID